MQAVTYKMARLEHHAKGAGRGLSHQVGRLRYPLGHTPARRQTQTFNPVPYGSFVNSRDAGLSGSTPSQDSKTPSVHRSTAMFTLASFCDSANLRCPQTAVSRGGGRGQSASSMLGTLASRNKLLKPSPDWGRVHTSSGRELSAQEAEAGHGVRRQQAYPSCAGAPASAWSVPGRSPQSPWRGRPGGWRRTGSSC